MFCLSSILKRIIKTEIGTLNIEFFLFDVREHVINIMFRNESFQRFITYNSVGQYQALLTQFNDLILRYGFRMYKLSNCWQALIMIF